MNITIRDYQGKEYSGKWNEKTYTSQIKERSDLKRIYLDNTLIHVTAEELENATGISKNATITNEVHRKIDNLFLNNLEKAIAIKYLLSQDFCKMMKNGTGTKEKMIFKINDNEIININSLSELKNFEI